MANTPLTELGADGGTSESLEPMTPSLMLETPHPALEPATVEETADPPVEDAGVAVSALDGPVDTSHDADGEARATDEDLAVAAPDEADDEAGAPAMDETAEPLDVDTSREARPDGALPAPAMDEAITPAALVDTLLAAATPRRNRRRQPEQRPGDAAVEAVPPHPEADVVGSEDTPAEHPDISMTAPTLTEDPLDGPAWRDHWPDNEVRIVGQLLPRVSEAPPLDGVQRTRMDLSLVEQHDGAFGSIGTLPLFVMPGAVGFGPIYREIVRARRQRQRLEPITVELEGVLRQMPDRDGRYATERYSVRMGVEVHGMRRVAKDAEQLAYWRGRVTVTGSRRYDHKGLPYRRVTGVVARKQRKPHLRGVSVTHIPVDFLVGPEHEHADRFRHVGQRLLVEATISGDVYRMSDDHPDLEGIDDPRRRAQLQVLRESVVTVTLGEFPDAAAEQEYLTWVKAGRPFASSQTRDARRSTVQPPTAPSVPESANGAAAHGPEDDQRQNGHGTRRRERREGAAGTEHERRRSPSSVS